MKKIHLIAIGGSVMHTLAIALKRLGNEITGSDDVIFDPAKGKLLSEDLLPEKEGWDSDKIHSSLDFVILGKHAKADNPELLKAKELDLPIYSFPEFIYEFSKQKQRIVICGSHGKTTITAMITHVLKHCGRKFDYLLGAKVDGFDLSVGLSESAPIMVIEGDEYLSSELDPRPKFLVYQPHICLISGIEWDHINVFPTEENYVNQFRILVDQLDKGASIIYNKLDETVVDIVNNCPDQEMKYFHPYEIPEYRLKESGQVEVNIEGQTGNVPFIGQHNLANMASAWEVCKRLSIPLKDFLNGISTFKGAARRLQKVSDENGKIVIRDFAHAPSKVRASVAAVNEFYPGKKIVGVLELHTYSSLNKEFIPNYKDSLQGLSKKVVLVDPHALKIKNMPALDQAFLRASFAEDDLVLCEDSEELRKTLEEGLGDEYVLLLMSSGNLGGLNVETL